MGGGEEREKVAGAEERSLGPLSVLYLLWVNTDLAPKQVLGLGVLYMFLKKMGTYK